MSDPVLDSIDHVLHDFDTSPDAMRWTPEPAKQPRMELTPDQIQALRRVFNTAGEAVARGIKSLTKAFERAGKAYLNFAHQVSAHDRTRCRVCRPYANPKPLAFGAEYHRRSRRRNRR